MEATKEQVMEEVLKVDAHAISEDEDYAYLTIHTFLPDEVGEHLVQEFDNLWYIGLDSVTVTITRP